jgi:hypothetical protein
MAGAYPALTLTRLPAEIFNQIYQLMLDDWAYLHCVSNMLRHEHGILAPMFVPQQAVITNEPYPLLLTPNAAFDPTAVPHNYIDLGLLPHIQNMHVFRYRIMRRALLAPGQICRQIREQYRSFQAARILHLVRIEEAPQLMSIFYPNTDPNDPVSSQYYGLPLYFVLPWNTNRLWKMLPYMDWYRRNHANIVHPPRIWCTMPNVPPGHVDHPSRLRRVLFRALPYRSILSYMQTGTGYNITSVVGRSHGHPFPGSHPARVETWLTGGDELGWVIPGNWLWPAAGLPTGDEVGPLTFHHWRLHELQIFLNRTGLGNREIRVTWEVAIGVVGKHIVPGRGI